MKAMILAAGLGTRLRPYTNHYAKPAMPFLNVPLLYYAVTLLKDGGASELILNSHHLPEQIEKLAAEIVGFEVSTRVSHEPGQPLGSGGGIWKAKSFLMGSGSTSASQDDSFLLANGDEVIFPSSLEVMPAFADAHKESDSLATIFVTRHPEVGTKFGGVWADGDGFVHGFGKTPPDLLFGPLRPLHGYHYVGVQALRNSIFDFLPEGESNILYDVLAAGLRAGHRVRIFEDNCRWFETGNPKDFLLATQECLEHDIHNPHSLLHKVLSVYGPDNTVKGTLLSERDCFVDLTAQLSGFVVIGRGARIEADATLKNVVVLPGAIVATGSRYSSEILL